MLDILLTHHLLQAVPSPHAPPGGDADQLPSSGRDGPSGPPGRRRHPAIRLTTIFRQAAKSRIVSNAHG